MKAVYGLYADGQSAQQAFNRLRAAGVATSDITVISAQPMEDYEFGNQDRATWMWWFACLGGLVGMSVGFGLAWLTETSCRSMSEDCPRSPGGPTSSSCLR